PPYTPRGAGARPAAPARGPRPRPAPLPPGPRGAVARPRQGGGAAPPADPGGHERDEEQRNAVRQRGASPADRRQQQPQHERAPLAEPPDDAGNEPHLHEHPEDAEDAQHVPGVRYVEAEAPRAEQREGALEDRECRRDDENE